MRSWVGLGALVVAAVTIAWLIRWGCDDAFIAFNYSRSLARGDGLTWFGTHVEGYTSFAWVVWVAIGIALGASPLVWSWAGSLAALATALLLTHRLVRLRGGSATSALGAVALLATNFTFLAFGTSGLETMLQCSLLIAATYQVEMLRRHTPTTLRLVGLSAIASFALWTRLDSAVVLLVLGVVTVHELVRARASLVQWTAAVLPALVLVGGWLAWKVVYYGQILPNTFHAKVDISGATVARSATFSLSFLHAYGLWPLMIVVAIVAIRGRLRVGVPLACSGAWLAYVIVVGGDFMEFRFFVPTLPLVMLVIAETVTVPGGSHRMPAPTVRMLAVVGVLAALSWRHAATDRGARDRFRDSVRALGTYYGLVPDGDWARLGRPLHEVLAESPATLATMGAGALPYYADLPTIDQLGLTDAWVAEHGVRPPATYLRPGHQRFAPADYLARNKVTFVVGSPTLVSRASLGAGTAPDAVRGWARTLLGMVPMTTRPVLVVAAPVSASSALLLWYLTPVPEVTTRLEQAGWTVLQLDDPR